MTKPFRLILVALLCVPMLILVAGRAPAAPVGHVSETLARLVSGDGPLRVGGRALDRNALQQLYVVRAFAPVWLEDVAGQASAQLSIGGHVLRRVLAAADEDGLDPRSLWIADIADRLGSTDHLVLAELDLLLTDALVRYAVQIRSGSVEPRRVNREFTIPRVDVNGVDAAESIIAATDKAAALAGLAPQHPEYARIRALLPLARAAVQSGGWPIAGQGPTLRVGMRDASVPALRARLRATGELTSGDDASTLYDADLSAAVRRFQLSIGLDADGVVGQRTRAQLNVTAEERERQIIANLERWRWMPDELGARHVIVNVPAYWLTAYQNGTVALDMPVVVGTHIRRTPMLASRIVSTTFNPTWTAPVRNAREDILPRVRRDPDYLDRQGFRVYTGWGADSGLLDHRSVDWSQHGRYIGSYRLVQRPGPNNPLGQFKFNIPNNYDIYLHDTPQQEKFEHSQRTFSSGCVRLGDPAALNAWLFSAHSGWSDARTQQILDEGRTRTVQIPQAVPVYLIYQTVSVTESGQPIYRDDIYGWDEQLYGALARVREQAIRTAHVIQ